MNAFTKIVVLLSFLFLIGLAGLTVFSIAGMNGEYFRDLEYRTDGAGVYQIVYPTPHGTLYYGRLQACGSSHRGNRPSCMTAWKPACKGKARLVAEGHWPLTRAGKVSRQSEDVPVFRYGPLTGPRVLVVQTASCYLEYPRAR